MTKVQARVLADVRAAGERRYNGRMRKTIEALQARGLVTADFDLVPHAMGKWTWRITVRPVAIHSQEDV
jgi:hypothetical protein